MNSKNYEMPRKEIVSYMSTNVVTYVARKEIRGSGAMAEEYYKPCKELDICNELMEKYWEKKEYKKCFEGHLLLAEQGYPLAECQVGFFYLEGIGVEKDLKKALFWTERAAMHGDRDGQCNLAWIYEEGFGVEKDMEKVKYWYKQAALQEHDLAIEKCRELEMEL